MKQQNPQDCQKLLRQAIQSLQYRNCKGGKKKRDERKAINKKRLKRHDN